MKIGKSKAKDHPGLCPLNCQKYRAVCHEAAEISEKNEHLSAAQDKLDSLIKLNSDNLCIIGIERQSNADYVVVMSEAGFNHSDGGRSVYVYQLPYHHRQNWICHMDMHYSSVCEAYIYDWSSRYPNRGHGSILMKHLIRYLRTAGFRMLTGAIMPTDYGHEEKLRHFYSKFNFKITDHSDHRSLRLDLFEKETRQFFQKGCEVCCRSDQYHMLESEALLADEEASKTT